MAVINPINAQTEGIMSRYRGNFTEVSMKKPKVNIVVGQGTPKDSMLDEDP
jgi:hypothetical protein